jgi:pantothenate kinase
MRPNDSSRQDAPVIRDLNPLVLRCRRLVERGGRLLGITGEPGAGKSTLARTLSEAYGLAAVVVPMDGFHLSQRQLRLLGREERKGAPDTFDGVGYVALMERIRIRDDAVYAPEFHREIEESVAAEIRVAPEAHLVITEGNYLLLHTLPWRSLRDILDEIWYLRVDESVRIGRLIARHMAFGRSRDQAEGRVYGSDMRNAEIIRARTVDADVIVELEQSISIDPAPNSRSGRPAV